MARKVILRKETIPNAEKALGKVAVHYNTGGNYHSSFSSSDVNNFDVVDEGVVEIRDPERSYLTSTLYPLSFVDAFRTEVLNNLTGILTDNLYANTGISEHAIVGAKSLQIPLFKRALIEQDYYSNFYPKDSFKVTPKDLQMTLRNVLITRDLPAEKYITRLKTITGTFRSVLIEYKYWSPDKIITQPTVLEVPVSTIFTTKFRTLLIGDSENVSTVISDKVVAIKDAGVLTWKAPETLTVERASPLMGNQSLIIDEDYEYLTSNQSIGVSSESGVELFFEDWFKPELSTKSLLTTYNYKSSFGEVPPLVDKASSFTWTSNKAFTDESFVLNNTQYLTAVGQSFKIPSPVSGQKGTTLEMTCTFTGTDRIYLVSNGSLSFNSAVGSSLALVWFGENSSTNKNKIAIVSDKTSLVDANNILVVSTAEYPTGSEVHIAVVAYEGYYRLFINGVLQGVKLVSTDLDFGYNNSLSIGKASWYNYTTSHTLVVKAFRFTNLALYTSAFTKPDPYKLTVIPNIPRVSDIIASYKTGVTCGLRYDQGVNSVYAFAAVTDTYGETFTVRSTAIDCSKWNFIQLANTGSELTLFINGVANSSKRLPYNIKFKDILIGGREANNFKGKMDNFRIYSKIKDSSPYLRSSELFMTSNNVLNTVLKDTNGLIVWKPVGTPSIKTSSISVRGVELAPESLGFYTENSDLLLNKNYFELHLGLNFQSYTANVVNTFTSTSGSTVTINYTSDQSLQFSFSTSTIGSIVSATGFTLEAVTYSATHYQLKVNIADTVYTLETPFKYGQSYKTLFFKLVDSFYLYVDNIQYHSTVSKSTVSFSTLTVTSNATVSSLSTFSFKSSERALIDNTESTNGLLVTVYEVFKNIFILSTTYDQLLYSVSELTIGTGYADILLKQDGSELSYLFNTIDSGVFTVNYVKGSSRLSILNTIALSKSTPLALSYFSAVSSQQDGVLSVPYQIDSIFNESLYKGLVLNLSTDASYGSAIVDRSASPKSKDVINLTEGYGVSKAIKEPGFYFDGKSSLEIDSPDFAFGVKDFYIEFEIKLENLDNRVVILDRYTNTANAWQVSINVDGHLYFTVTTATTSPNYYFIDVPVKISTKKWHKIQISRSGSILKFYLDDEFAYEYSTGSSVDFNNTGVKLNVGRQMDVRNPKYDFKGYLNNLRIVKGYSLESEYVSSSTLETVAYTAYDTYLSDDFNSRLVEYGVETAKGSKGTVFTNSGLTLGSGSGYGYLDSNCLKGGGGAFATATVNFGSGDFRFSFDFLYNQLAENGYANAVLQLGSSAEGTDGFAFSIFTNTAGDPLAYLRNAYGNIVSLPCPNNAWHKISISKESGVLYLTIDGVKSKSLGSSVDFNTDKTLTLGRMSGAWLQYNTVYLDNVRLATGTASLDTYASEEGSSGVVTTESAESYSMYTSTSSTVLHLDPSSGSIKETKGSTITITDVPVQSVSAPSYGRAMYFNGNSKITTASNSVDTLFGNATQFTCELSFATLTSGYDQTILSSFNTSLQTVHWVLKLGADLKTISLSYNTGSGFKGYTLDVKLFKNTWYKFAFTLDNSTVTFHLNDDVYRFEEKATLWQSKGTLGALTSVGESFKGLIETVKLTNRVQYVKGKGIRNINRDSQLHLTRGLLTDDGNKPLDWTTTGYFENSLFKDNLKSLRLTSTEHLTAPALVNPGLNPFAITANISFNDITADFNILSITFEDNLVITLNKKGTSVNLTLTSEGEVVSTASFLQSALLSTYNKICLSRDFSSVLELQVNGTKVSLGSVETQLKGGSLFVTGFNGQVHELEVFNNDISSVLTQYNILRLTFEKGSVTENYCVAKDENLIFENYNCSEVKGLSRDSDSALAFDGTSSFLITPENEKLNFGSQDFEVSLEIYPTNGTNIYQPLLSNNSNEAPFYLVLFGTSGMPNVAGTANRIGVCTSLTEKPLLLSSITLPFNLWTTVKLVRSGANLSLYLNNALDIQVAVGSTPFNLGTGSLLVGKSEQLDDNSFFAGYMDTIAISQRGSYYVNEDITLSEGLISGLNFEDVGVAYEIIKSPYKPDYVDSYTNTWSYGRYNDSAEYPYHETVSAVNEALYFPGRSYMFMYNKHFAPGLDPFSLSVDFMQTLRTSSYIFCIDTMYHLRVSSNNLYFRFNGNDYNLGSLDLNVWYTFAIARDTVNTIRLFINGKVVLTLSNNKTNVDQGTSFYPMVLGRRWDYRDHPSYFSENFIGYIDNFYYERGLGKYTEDYVVFTDKSLTNTYNSLLNFTASGPTEKSSGLTWSHGGLSFVQNASEFRAVAAKNSITTSYLQSTALGTNLGYNDFTLEFYFRPSQIVAESCILDLSLDTVTQRGIKIIQPASSASSVSVQVGSSTAAEWDFTMNTGINTIENNKTYHLRLTRNLGTMYLYLDGSLREKYNYISYISINSMVTLFNNISRNKGFNGLLEQFRFKIGQSFSAEASFPKLTGEFK